MRRLVHSEWIRLWRHRIFLLMLAALPVAAYAAAGYMRKANAGTDPALPQYAVAGNFSVLGFEEMLLTVFNLAMIVLAAYVVTDEYRSGALRMVMQRAYTFGQIIAAKALTLAAAAAVLCLWYLLWSTLFGYLLLPHADAFALFYREGTVHYGKGLLYALQFYGIGLLTLLAMTAVLLFFAVISRSVTAAMGLGIGFLLLSLLGPQLLSYFAAVIDQTLFFRLYFASLPMIQWQGIVFLLADSPRYAGWMCTVLAGYLLLFGTGAYLVFTKRDRWI
ncbi:ABC transporter permease [Gorillibacterium timonense]|uniref:ABC transporter permease n=1 Tax=Gorillibacterium timonense TaxID=1689269 RepID=UPI00071D9065|nr:ABC transporter permease [Gorillibacterium timonense]